MGWLLKHAKTWVYTVEEVVEYGLEEFLKKVKDQFLAL
jgi:hypothetical protein